MRLTKSVKPSRNKILHNTSGCALTFPFVINNALSGTFRNSSISFADLYIDIVLQHSEWQRRWDAEWCWCCESMRRESRQEELDFANAKIKTFLSPFRAARKSWAYFHAAIFFYLDIFRKLQPPTIKLTIVRNRKRRGILCYFDVSVLIMEGAISTKWFLQIFKDETVRKLAFGSMKSERSLYRYYLFPKY